MNTQISRRRFIQTTGGLAVAAGALSVGNSVSAAERDLTLISTEKKRWPVGCRDVHLKNAGKADSWACMNALGAECTEADVGMNLSFINLFHPTGKYTLATEDGIKALKNDMGAAGVRISAFMMSNRFDEQLEKELDWTRRLVKAAGQLGVKVIRIDVVPRKLVDREAFLDFSIKACKQMCEIVSDTPICYGVENHGKLTNDPQVLERLFDGVGSAKLGLTLDCANFYWWGHPLSELYKIYQKFAPRVVHTHCKSIRYPGDKKNVRREMGWEYGKYNCPIYEGDLDFKRIVKILRQANYGGDLCVEDESLGKFPEPERGEVLKKEIAMLKALA